MVTPSSSDLKRLALRRNKLPSFAILAMKIILHATFEHDDRAAFRISFSTESNQLKNLVILSNTCGRTKRANDFVGEVRTISTQCHRLASRCACNGLFIRALEDSDHIVMLSADMHKQIGNWVPNSIKRDQVGCTVSIAPLEPMFAGPELSRPQSRGCPQLRLKQAKASAKSAPYSSVRLLLVVYQKPAKVLRFPTTRPRKSRPAKILANDMIYPTVTINASPTCRRMVNKTQISRYPYVSTLRQRP